MVEFPPDVDGPAWLSPLLLIGVCTSCVGLAGVGVAAVAVLGAFWANLAAGLLALGLFVGWLHRGNPFRDRDACEAEPGAEGDDPA